MKHEHNYMCETVGVCLDPDCSSYDHDAFCREKNHPKRTFCIITGEIIRDDDPNIDISKYGDGLD